MLSKSFIQVFIDEWACVLSLWFGLRSNYGRGHDGDGHLFQRTCSCTAVFSAPDPQQATVDPPLCRRHLDTHRQIWLSLLWGHCSFLLAPGLCPPRVCTGHTKTPSSNNTRDDSTHGHHQVVNTEIRLIIFFASEDRDTLNSQQQQHWELTMAQIIKSLLPYSDLN